MGQEIKINGTKINTENYSMPNNLNKNNPAYKLAEGNIPTILKDILENGELGTPAKRIAQEIAQAVIKENKFYNKFGKQLKGTGARTNLLSYFTRKGWHNRQKNENYDFKGMQEVDVLSENLITNLMLETEAIYSTLDLKDTEKGYEILWNLMVNALMVELPVEFEKRCIAMFEDLKANGVNWRNDQNISAVATPEVISIQYGTEGQTKQAVEDILNIINKKTRMENALVYKPGTEKWELIITPEFDDAIQRIGAYEVVGGDKTYGNFLSNKPTKFIKGGIPVDIDNTLPVSTPFILKAKNGAFGNIEVFYTSLPTNMLSRIDYVGASAELKFIKMNTDEFSFNISYWAVEMGLVVFGTNLDSNVSYGRANFVAQTSAQIQTGDVSVIYKINALDTTNLEIALVKDFERTPLASGAAIVVDGTETTLADVATGLDNGSYAIEITDGNDLIYRSATFVVRNKSTLFSEGGTNTNEAISGTTPQTTKAEAIVEKAKAEAKK